MKPRTTATVSRRHGDTEAAFGRGKSEGATTALEHGRGEGAPVLALTALLLAASLPALAQPAANTDARVAHRRLAHLRHGLNLSHWFAQVFDPRGYTQEHFEAFNTAADAALIKAMGFDHVRLSVNPQPMFTRKQADRIPAEYLGWLDAAVKLFLDQGVAVVLDMHPESEFKQKLGNDDEFVEQFEDFWRGFAGHFATLDPELAFFEVLNEPEIRDRHRWAGIQTRLAAAIREGAPRHTIVATGARWGDLDDLLFVQPLRDPNVIYNFHFYTPHVFTHQGATWGENYWHFVGGLPYPSAPESAARVAAQVPDPVTRLAVLRYGLDRWDAARIEAEVAQVAAWAKRWDVPVTCNEFGVYRRGAFPSHRAAWLEDLRRSLEKHGFGWAMWDYAGGFGVVTKENGQAAPDELTLRALGRTVPAVKPVAR